VDELHTFDGAQGTDLACLIRRLKARLKTPHKFLCCVGTSATLGNDDEKLRLVEYAQEVFGEPFEGDAVITESRVSAGEYLAESFVTGRDVVSLEKAGALDPEAYENPSSYLRAQHSLWFHEEIPEDKFPEPGWRVALGEQLKGHYFFQNLLKALEGKPQDFRELLDRLERVTPELRGAPPEYGENLLNSLLSLVSVARVWLGGPSREDGKEIPEGLGPTSPFLQVRVQLWLRELRRMVGEVSQPPGLTFADDLNDEQLKRHLPVVNCRECGSTAWAGLKRQKDSFISGNLEDFYPAFFGDDPKVTFLFPEETGAQNRPMESGISLFCPHCFNLTERLGRERCPSCNGGELVRVFVSNQRVQRGERVIARHDCP
jgi:DEAD/DEAH box helicase domain-containing protein